MFAKIGEYSSLIYRWARNHKIISILLVVSAVLMVLSRFASLDAGSSADSGVIDKMAVRDTVYGFVEGYGSWSYMDAFDTKDLERYAHKDLVQQLIEERVSEFTSPGEAVDAEAAKQLAYERMQQRGIVRVASIYDISVLSNEQDVIQLQVEVEEYRFSNDTGMVKSKVTYTMDIERSSSIGITSPYKVVRFLKDL